MRVFSTEKFIEYEGLHDYEENKCWMVDCEGKTEEEMESMGYATDSDWMVEKEVTE